MFRAQIKGTVRKVLNNEKLKLTGEKLTIAIVGFPTNSCHHGTKTETAIKTKVRIPAVNAR